jgi:hypothetical protein
MELPCPDAYSVFFGFSLCVVAQILPKIASHFAHSSNRVEKKTTDDETCRVSERQMSAADTREPEEETAPAMLVEEHATVRRPRQLVSCQSLAAALLVCSFAACFLRENQHGKVEEIKSRSSSMSSEMQTEEQPGILRTVNLTRQVIPLQRVNGKLKYKSAYWGTLGVGTPRVSFKLVFDTGSGHLILPSSFCFSPTCKQHKRYRRSQSRTAKDIDHDGSVVNGSEGRDQLTVHFGKGSVDGVFIDDIVCLNAAGFATDGKVEFGPRDAALEDACMNLRFIAATDMSEDPFAAFEFDGILGLGLPSLSQTPEFNFVSVLGESGIFAIHLADEGKDEPSEITFGGWKPDRYQGNVIYWNQVVMPEHGHWMLRIKSIYVDDENLDICNDDCNGIADTGSSLLSVPSMTFNKLFTALRHEPTGLNCRGPGPTLRIVLENFEIQLEPANYARFDPGANETDQAVCKAMMMVMNMPEPLGPKLFILGEPILRKYYSVFDSKNLRIGFAPSQQ